MGKHTCNITAYAYSEGPFFASAAGGFFFFEVRWFPFEAAPLVALKEDTPSGVARVLWGFRVWGANRASWTSALCCGLWVWSVWVLPLHEGHVHCSMCSA